MAATAIDGVIAYLNSKGGKFVPHFSTPDNISMPQIFP